MLASCRRRMNFILLIFASSESTVESLWGLGSAGNAWRNCRGSSAPLVAFRTLLRRFTLQILARSSEIGARKLLQRISDY